MAWIKAQMGGSVKDIYIFDKGDQVVEKTGGYLSYPYGHKNRTDVSKNFDQALTITNISGGVRLTSEGLPADGRYRSGIYTTHKSIDVTKYSKIRFKLSFAATGNWSNCTYLWCGLTKTIEENFTWEASAQRGPGFSGDLEIDISSVTGNIYPIVEGYCYNYTRACRIDLFEIELIK